MNKISNPFISIITVVYNNADVIESTIISIVEQRFDDVEYIIIDGGSTDGTVDIIKKYQQKITYWISEVDNGIYDAMNKGIKMAKGKYLVFMNSGDLLLEIPFKILMNNANDLNAFPVNLSTGSIFYPTIGPALKIRNTLPHQGCYYKNNPKLLYDTKFNVFSDFHLNQRMYKKGMSISVFKTPIVAFHDIGGISHNKKYGMEIFKVVKENFGPLYKYYSWFYFKKQGLKMRFQKILR
jgi:glycosyltransferase involved in cell wall biosynthesis